MDERDFSQHIVTIKAAWDDAFKEMQNYYESGIFKRFSINYDASTWHRFKNPALIYPTEREMRFSTPNARVPFDYYPSRLAKLGILGHNFAYLADIEEFYPYNFSLFLWEQKEYITPLQRANLRAAQFMPDALVEVTREGLRSFLKARGKENGMGTYEDPLVILETLGLMGMPRRDNTIQFFKELSEAEEAAFDTFLETPYIFSFAGFVTPPALNNDKSYGIKRRDDLTQVTVLIRRYTSAEITDEELNKELINFGYVTMDEESVYKPEESVDLRWIKLDYAMERVKKAISEYTHKAAHSSFYCYADMAAALRRIYEKEVTARKSYA